MDDPGIQWELPGIHGYHWMASGGGNGRIWDLTGNVTCS